MAEPTFSPEQIADVYISLGGNISATARHFGLTRTTIRQHLRKTDAFKGKIVDGKIKSPKAEKRAFPKGDEVRRYILTSAQNNTYVHEKFWDNLIAYRDYLGAELLVGTFSYNINAYGKLAVKRGHAPSGSNDLWFDTKLLPFIEAGDDRNIEIAPGLIWCGRANILPTAVRPLSGFETYTGRASGIFPHSKIELQSIASGKHEATKFNYTTGTVTQRNYIQKKAGLKAEHAHCYGALLVEVDGEGNWFVRQLNATDDGSFYDLDILVTNSTVQDGFRVEGITWGDIHAAVLDPDVREQCWGAGGMVDALQPNYQFMHDLIDFRARNHHDRNDPHVAFRQFVDQKDSVEREMQQAADFLGYSHRDYSKTVVVNSNHDNAFLRWLKECDYRRDPPNAVYFLQSQLAIYEAIEKGQDLFPVEWAMRRAKCPEGVKFLREDESFVICRDKHGGIECGMHGHLGVNGAKASPLSLSKMGRKANTGHTHSASIIDGMYVAGVSATLDMTYNRGPSSWSRSHIITYRNGKRCIVTMWNNKWRA